MKKLGYIFLIAVIIVSLFATMAISSYAEEDVATGDEVQEGELSTKEELLALKEELFGVVKELWAFIQNDDTYRNVFTAILAVLAFLILPVVIALVVTVYISMGAVIIVAGALTDAMALFISLVARYLPM